MKTPRCAWTRVEAQPKPASELDIRFGHDLLKENSSTWPNYFVVTSPNAHQAVRSSLAQEPAGGEHAHWLDWAHLQEITDRVPRGVELIVGIGGGTALDASKYVALKKQLPLILVPTIVSSGSIIHGHFARWDGRKTIGSADTWPWIDFEHVLIDYDVVLQAPEHLNTAGIGDVLCGYSPIAEWRRKSRIVTGSSFDELEAAPLLDHFQHIVSEFSKTLTAQGGLTDDSIRVIMTVLRDRDSKRLTNPEAPASEHSLWLGAEEINEKGWVHGEFVAMGAVIVAWYCRESPQTLIDWLQTCRVRWRPSQIGVSREELLRSLEFAPAFMSDTLNNRDVDSILRHKPLVGKRFEALWQFLQK